MDLEMDPRHRELIANTLKEMKEQGLSDQEEMLIMAMIQSAFSHGFNKGMDAINKMLKGK